jgi:ABC-2 type transport system ATP-binding protein
LDEPTIGLDPTQIIEIRQLIKSLAGEHTVILSSHILPEVEQTCGRVIIINKGKIIAEDTPGRLSRSLRGANVYTVTVRRPSQIIADQLKRVEGVREVRQEGDGVYFIESSQDSDVREEIASLLVKQNAGLLELRPVSFTLEDVYVQLTTAEQQPAAPTAVPAPAATV